ncbi:MAG: hypothetical protein QXO57_04005 [Candidatus Aenigmatarchaeota archaeon]
MANSLRKLIEKQLKENVPLAEIKQGLKEKGYAIEEIDKAVHEAIAGTSKKFPIHTFQIIILVVGAAIAIVVGIYFTSGYKPSSSYQQFCKNFPKVSGEITCENAIQTVLNTHTGDLLISKVNKTEIGFKNITTGEVRKQVYWDIYIQNSNGRGRVIVSLNGSEVRLLEWGR